ncbi:MAG: TonB-dependent receptor [Bacteroidia bacterium]|nr:TonB-dependent receptor [Bacteroidia bacterium]
MKRFPLLFLLLLLGLPAAFGQTLLRGIIRDEMGDPLMGATVIIKDANLFAAADTTGAFAIKTPAQLPFTLLVRFVSYQSQEIQITELPAKPLEITLISDDLMSVIITSRRRKEIAQDVPIPISVVAGAQAEDAGAFNVNRLKELIPTVQLYSSNPRNTGLSIRGLGTTFGLTNDGIDPGVGFYVDGVYFARPAATTLDFIDVEQIEVLRGPQGTLFGKNTTAGAFNVTTRRPSFIRNSTFEASYGNYGFIQARGSVTGPLTKNLAARFSFSGTQRDGLLYNTAAQDDVNDLNNLGLRGQLLYTPASKIAILAAADLTRQRPEGYAQVFAGVAPTLRPAYRQFEQIIADLDYTLPSRNPFDRLVDHDTPWRSNQDLGGASVNIDIELGPGTLTSTSAWRYWNWDPSNDRDFTGLQGLALSQAPSRHEQWSQEIRYAGSFFDGRLSGVLGLFAFYQTLDADSAHTEEAGRDQWRFSQNSTSPLWQTPGLLDGYGLKTYPSFRNFSGAAFGQADLRILEQLHLLSGIRLNYDEKTVDFRREAYGGLQTSDPALLALKRSVYSNQSFTADIEDTNLSGQVTLAYKPGKRLNAFATYSTGFKPVGLNLGGLPVSGGEPMVELAVIRPERVQHVELGIKTVPVVGTMLNLTVYQTSVRDYQTLVQAPDLAVNRGYLANAEEIRVRGAELDARARIGESLTLYGSLAYTEGIYVSFTNAPPPLEETGGPTFKDVSGGQLPGISPWAASAGGEWTGKGKLLGQEGDFFIAADSYYRSSFSSSPSPSQYLNIDGYALLNGRLGFRSPKGLTVFFWGRNLLDAEYFEQLLPGAGNAGHYAAVLGDPRTYGITLRQSF